jgi:hypothetical protein
VACHLHAMIDILPVSQTAIKFRNYTHSEPRFRALLTEGDSEMELALV